MIRSLIQVHLTAEYVVQGVLGLGEWTVYRKFQSLCELLVEPLLRGGEVVLRDDAFEQDLAPEPVNRGVVEFPLLDLLLGTVLLRVGDEVAVAPVDLAYQN